MSTFLNRPAIVEGVLNIIRLAKKEVIMVVPYIKLSDTTYQLLKEANEREVEITIIYREDKLHSNEKQKLLAMDNLNLLCHAEIHSKCYFNEAQMIIASMNLYDYSEKYNREMGILVEKDAYSGNTYKDALEEVKDIIRSAKLEKKSRKATENGFNPQVLRPEYEKLIVPSKVLNKYFDNKLFEALENRHKGEVRCKGYYENMDVLIEPDFSKEINQDTGEFFIQRAAIDLKWDEETLKRVNIEFDHRSAEFRYPGFKVYWDYFSKNVTIYRDKFNQPKWNGLNHEQTLSMFKEGIENVTEHLRRLEKQLRKAY
jgi:hypothetical protein